MWLPVALFYLIYLAIAVPVTAAATCAVYTAAIPGAYFLALAKVLLIRPGSLPEPQRRPRVPEDADPAVLQYFYGPAVTDADQAVRIAYGSSRELWYSGKDRISSAFTTDAPLFTGPLGIGGAIGMAAGGVLGTLAAAGCAFIHLLTVGISAAIVRAVGAVVRGADSLVLRVKNIRMICPECYERVPYPGYLCPGENCPRRHRDIRPGRFGILRRRCQCGTPMNTLLLFGSSRMTAICPRGHLLEHRPGEAPEIVLPLFGATGSGKTRLLFSMVTQLLARDREGKVTAEFADSVTTRELAGAEQILRSGRPTSVTLVQLPRAYVIRLATRKGPRILHMFDAAGERFYNAGRTQELLYLGKARTFILVIDPLSVDSYWAGLPPARQAELKPLRSAAPSPDLAYQQTHQEIEAMGVRLREARLAVVFSRGDLIGPPAGDVARWACRELGLGNLVRSARLTFGEASFFLTAAVMRPDGLIHDSVPVLLRWLLADDGVPLPEAAS